jgi:RNA polymerase sigma-70 factor (ECF subfamily)
MLYSLDQQSCSQATNQALAEFTDEQLMEQIKQGDEKALECLQRRHRGLMHTIISRVTGNDHDTDDTIQEVILQIWERAKTYCAERGHALGWIVTMVRRRAIDRVRRRTAYLHAQERLREESKAGGENNCIGSDEQVAQSDRAEVVARLIERLPELQQEVVRLAFYQGMSQRQIAAHTGIPLGTIKTRMDLALRKLRSAALAFGEFHGETQVGRPNVLRFPTPTACLPTAA